MKLCKNSEYKLPPKAKQIVCKNGNIPEEETHIRCSECDIYFDGTKKPIVYVLQFHTHETVKHRLTPYTEEFCSKECMEKYMAKVGCVGGTPRE